jgi:hypothetical protein
MILRFSIAAAAFALGSAAVSQEVPENPVCEVKGKNGMVTLLLCPEGLDDVALAGEGKAACNGRLPCGAWIWENELDMPAETPDSHAKLSPEQITASRGVWMNELNQMVIIGKETN